MLSETMSRTICCKKLFWIYRNGSNCNFRLMDFPKLTINWSHSESFKSLFQGFWAVETKDGQGIFTRESSLQTLPIDWFAKEAYCLVKILHRCNRLSRNNRSDTFFNISLKENILFIKRSFGIFFPYLLNFIVKALIRLILLIRLVLRV